MKTILVTGMCGSGKTTTALKKAVSMGHQEILYVTDEINVMEFVILLDRLFGNSLSLKNGDIIIDEVVRITYRKSIQPVNPMGCKYDITICDTILDLSKCYYSITREYVIQTQQMNKYHEIIVCGEIE